MAVNYRQVSDVNVGSSLIVERTIKGETETIAHVTVQKKPFQKGTVWYIPLETPYDENGNIIDDRQNFVQVIEYTSQGMFKISEAKIIYLNKQSFIITKNVFKLVNRRGSVRVPVSIESSFKVAGESVWVKSTAIDISLTGCRLRATIHDYEESDVEFFNERKPAITLNFRYNGITIALLGTIQRASLINRGVLELGCKCEDNQEYHRMCIAEQVAMAKMRRK